MSRNLGAGILLAGVVCLGWWGTAHQAHRMEHRIADAAGAVAAGSVHGITASVAGRDITATGLADSTAEHERLIGALNKVRGRRVVRDDLRILAPASPYITRIEKSGDGTLTAAGSLPSETTRAALAALIGTAAAGPQLASGAPEAQVAQIERGAAALALMRDGEAKVTDGALVLAGHVTGPDARDAVAAVIAGLPEGAARADLILDDDGTPPNWSLDFSALGGGVLNGKLPKGFDPAALATALGLASVRNDARTSTLGEPVALPGLFVKLARWLPELEMLHVAIAANAPATVDAGTGKGADLNLLRERMLADLGAGVTLNISEVPPGADDGAERVNVVTGTTERLTSGYWIPVAGFAIDRSSCQAESNEMLSTANISFVTGSDRLDATALRVLNRLASVVVPCAGSGLSAEIGGHTDNTGEITSNLILSQRRADAVRQALIARGVPADLLRAQGYGAAQPAADNTTDEGRARNRRTTVVWSE